jgi:hypothetical protein
VGLLEHPDARQPHLVDHEQPQVTDEAGGQVGVGHVGAGHVEAEALGLQGAAVEEGHVGVELGSVLGHAPRLRR